MSQMKGGRKVPYTNIQERYSYLKFSTEQTYRYKNHNVAEKRIGSTMVPNRIFVGGLNNGTTEHELRNFFSNYGEVKVVKIVKDKSGAVKGFGFITFGSEDEVKKIIEAGPVLMFKEKHINVAPAFEKDNKMNYDSNNSQQQSHVMPYSSSQVQQYSIPPLPTQTQPMLAPIMYTYQNGMAFFNMPANGNTSLTQSSGLQNSTSTESLIPSVYATAPYGTQSAANMQGYSGQPIFYPNPAPQVLVQQAYPNLPVSSVCNGTPGSKVVFSVPCETPYYSGTQMSNMVPTPDMAYPMPIMSPYMPYMVATSDGGYPYYDPVMENMQLVPQPIYNTEQCTNPRPSSSDASVGQSQVITTNQFVSLMSVVRNDEDKPQMYTSEPQQLCITPVISLAEPSSQSIPQSVVSKPATSFSSLPDPEKPDQSPNHLLMTQIQYNIRHPPPSLNIRPEQKDSVKHRNDAQQYQGNNNNLAIKNNNNYNIKNGSKKYPETRTFYKTGPNIAQPRHPNGSMVNSSFTSPFFVPNSNFRHRFPKVQYPAVPQVMLNPNYPYPNQGNVRPSNGQQMFNNTRGARHGNNHFQNNKKNYSSYKGNKINRYTTDQIDNPEVSSSEDSRTDQLTSSDMGPPQVEGMCSDIRSMTI